MRARAAFRPLREEEGQDQPRHVGSGRAARRSTPPTNRCYLDNSRRAYCGNRCLASAAKLKFTARWCPGFLHRTSVADGVAAARSASGRSFSLTVVSRKLVCLLTDPEYTCRADLVLVF